jgi:PAS domain S-box-containing protein
MDIATASELELELKALRSALAQAHAQLSTAGQRSLADEARQQHHAAIIEASRDAIWSWDNDGTIRSWNAEAAQLFGYSGDEIVGKSLFTLVPAARITLAREALAEVLAGGWIGPYRTERVRKDGTPIPVELTVSPIRGTAGAIIGAATVCRDIAERQQFEASLSRRMNEFAALYRFTDRLHQARCTTDVYDAALDAILSALDCERVSILFFDAAGGDAFGRLARIDGAMPRGT